jgi:predicted Zn-dependent protease
MSDAIERHKRMVEQFPDNELARFSLGKAYFDAAQYAAAKAQFETALARKPDWMAVQILIGRCELNLGNTAAAKAALLRARELAMQQKHTGPRAEVEQLLEDLGITSE